MDDDHQDSEESFFGGNKEQSAEAKPQEEQVVTKSKAHRRRPIHKKRQKGHKRSHSNKEKEKETKLFEYAERKVEDILEEMDRRFERDIELSRRKQLACKKLGYLDELAKSLKNVYIGEKFVEMNGLGMLEKWLGKVSSEQGQVEPAFALRKGVFELLLVLNIRSDYLSRSQELERIIQRHKRSQMRELRQLSEAIIKKWSQMSLEE